MTQRSIASDVPLELAIHGDRLVVRQGSTRAEFLELDRDRLVRGRELAGRRVSPIRFTETGMAIGFVDDELVLQQPDELEPRWRLAGHWRGAPSALEENVFAVTYEKGMATLVRVDERTGEVRDVVPIGHHGGSIPTLTDRGPSIHVLPDSVWVRYDRPVLSTSKGEFDAVRVWRGEDGALSEDVRLFHILHDPLALPAGTLVLQDGEHGRRWAVALGGRESRDLRVLADEERAPELLEVTAPAVGENLLYLGRDAVDLITFEVRFRLAVEPLDQPRSRVERSPRAHRAQDARALPESAPTRSGAGTRAGRRSPESRRDWGAVSPRWPSSRRKAGDRELTERLVSEAELRDARTRQLDDARRALERWRRGTRPPRVRTEEAASVRARERALLDAGDDELVALARQTDAAERHAILEHLFGRRPDHQGALGLLLRDLPDGIRDVSGDPLGWLKLARLATQDELRFVGAEGTSRAAKTRLATERARWRPDLIGVETDRIVLVGPPSVPAALARGVRVGSRVTGALDEIFGVDAQAREPLSVLVHPDRASYEAFASEGLHGWAAGHYSPAEHVSHLFVPEAVNALERFRVDLRSRADAPLDRWPRSLRQARAPSLGPRRRTGLLVV